MTGQSLLDLMEVINNETQNQAGEADVVRSLVALNAAQDYFESVVATFPYLLGGKIGTVTTTLSTESTAFPTGLLRIDKLQYIDPNTSRPAWDLSPRYGAGSHAPSNFWPYNLFVSSTTVSGKPQFYWTNGTNIYWDPLPDGTNTVRWYGFQVAADITASGTFSYPDIVALPLAAFAQKLGALGVDDSMADHSLLAQQTFAGTIVALDRFNRTGAAPMNYRYVHLA